MISRDQLTALQGRTMYGEGGEKIGDVDVLYADRDTGEPTFATVSTGFFGTRSSFVPLAGAELRGDDVHVPYGKDLVKDAPNVDGDEALTPDEESRLYRHYGLTAGTGTTSGTTTGTTPAGTAGTTGSGDAMTRSEEHLVAGTTTEETGRARLRKYVTTETETVQVPVSKERVTLEREPVTDADRGAATDGPAITEDEHEVVLHEERVVVGKETRPVERVRLGTEVETEVREVSDEVRKEQIAAEGDVYPSEGTTDRASSDLRR